MDKKLHFALLGHPVGHSFSAIYLNNKFKISGINADYNLIDLKSIDDFPFIMQQQEWNGFNVTIPYKKSIIPYLDELSPTAEQIGAVNTVEIIRNQNSVKLIGHNTDITGFEQTLNPLLKKNYEKALILGTGGVAQAVHYVLNKAHIQYLDISRNHNTNDCIAYDEITPKIMQDHKLIINCTPLGMYPNTNTCPDIPYEKLTAEHLLYDLVYNPEETLFLKKGKEQHAATLSGLQMLYIQADTAFNIWMNTINI